MTLSSVLKLQLLAPPPSPTLKHACPLCILGSALTAFPSIQTNQKSFSSAHINGFELSRQHHLSTIFLKSLNAFSCLDVTHMSLPISHKISDTEVELSDQITSLGVVMDSNLTFNAHITALCKACHFHLRSLRHIRRLLTDDMAILIAVALVQSRLDYCNSLFFSIL